MSLLLDHPFFDALGLGDAKRVAGGPKAPAAQAEAHDLTPVEKAAADPWSDVEARAYAMHASGAAVVTVPRVLEYHRPDEDEELNFIPKTVSEFALGVMVMGFCLNLTTLVLFSRHSAMDISLSMAYRFFFAVGITGVASSLLLVGLKVRADHSAVVLHSRHGLNAIGTGAAYALLVWGPWLMAERGVPIDRFVESGIWMLLFVFPLIAARWTVGPARRFGV